MANFSAVPKISLNYRKDALSGLVVVRSLVP